MITLIRGKVSYMGTIGERIKQRRIELGYNQTDIGKYVGVTRSAVSLWETGDSKGLRPESLVKAAEILKTTEKWLTFGAGEKERNPSILPVACADPEKIKLFAIIDAAEKAINDSGKTLTNEEKLECYFEALDFAGRKHFGNSFVKQYVAELLKQNKNNNENS